MPKVSVIVPTNNPTFLRDTLNSVIEQTFTDWELVLVPNGKCRLGDAVPKDPRIRIVPLRDNSKNIGKIKMFGFMSAAGEILVELDHDDLLLPTALADVVEGFSDGTDFVYSNNARFVTGSWEPDTFGGDNYKNYGWHTREFPYKEHDLLEMVAFEPSPSSMGHIWYAPDHIRAWTKKGYLRAGGHDPKLPVADDHDLVIRTYLQGTMKHIDKCLYLYRVHTNQTSAIGAERNAEIQSRTHQLYAKNIDDLVLRWCDLQNLPAYDLGGGLNPARGWRAVDIDLREIEGERVDLRERWPWPDSSVGAFRAFDTLEHLPDKNHVMSEAYRCLAPGGWFCSLTPSGTGSGAHADPTHVSYWSDRSFLPYCEKEQARYIGNTTIRFQPRRLLEAPLYMTSAFINDGQPVAVPYITADLVCLKEGYHGPGIIRI